MQATVRTVAFQGIDVLPVDVQVMIAPGTIAFSVVGLADKAVGESRERVRAALRALGLALPPQRITVNLSPADLAKEGSHYDLPIALGVMAADCAPVLLADGSASVIGAAHAGWKGALGGVVDATIAAMEKLGARREHIRVVVGPCIGPASYEVGPEFPAPFLAQDEANAAFFRAATRAGHFMFDLPGYLVHRIARNGVAVSATGHDTLTGTDDFFSYRRNTLQGVRDYGRGLSAIALAA